MIFQDEYFIESIILDTVGFLLYFTARILVFTEAS